MIAPPPGSLGACLLRRRCIATLHAICFVPGLLMLSGLTSSLCDSLELWHLSFYPIVSLWARVPAPGPLYSSAVPFITTRLIMYYVNLAVIFVPFLSLAILLLYRYHVS
jgi:hypothetical protein